jgi:hypothetical protein
MSRMAKCKAIFNTNHIDGKNGFKAGVVYDVDKTYVTQGLAKEIEETKKEKKDKKDEK